MPKAVQDIKLETAPFDPRFPNANQTKACFQNYVDYYRCINKRGEKYDPCNYFKRAMTVLCPISWIESWDEKRENDIFPIHLN